MTNEQRHTKLLEIAETLSECADATVIHFHVCDDYPIEPLQEVAEDLTITESKLRHAILDLIALAVSIGKQG